MLKKFLLPEDFCLSLWYEFKKKIKIYVTEDTGECLHI